MIKHEFQRKLSEMAFQAHFGALKSLFDGFSTLSFYDSLPPAAETCVRLLRWQCTKLIELFNQEPLNETFVLDTENDGKRLGRAQKLGETA